jgi:CsoR family transcriptional regulator, copper-sensing transcriptional repressor
VKQAHKDSALRRLQTAVGHLQGVVRMVEDDAYCPDIMKQLSAVQGALERVNRLVLRNHLETCVADAMQHGRVEEIVDELMTALKFDPSVTGASDGAIARSGA